MPGEVTGVASTIRAMRGKAKNTGVRIADGLAAYGDVVLTKALYYCPVEKGDLRATGVVTSRGRGFDAQTTVSFGGRSPTGEVVDYAIEVHEDQEAAHAPPTCARFVSRAARETRGTGTAMVKRSLLVEDARKIRKRA